MGVTRPKSAGGHGPEGIVSSRYNEVVAERWRAAAPAPAPPSSSPSSWPSAAFQSAVGDACLSARRHHNVESEFVVPIDINAFIQDIERVFIRNSTQENPSKLKAVRCATRVCVLRLTRVCVLRLPRALVVWRVHMYAQCLQTTRIRDTYTDTRIHRVMSRIHIRVYVYECSVLFDVQLTRILTPGN